MIMMIGKMLEDHARRANERNCRNKIGQRVTSNNRNGKEEWYEEDRSEGISLRQRRSAQ